MALSDSNCPSPPQPIQLIVNPEARLGDWEITLEQAQDQVRPALESLGIPVEVKPLSKTFSDQSGSASVWRLPLTLAEHDLNPQTVKSFDQCRDAVTLQTVAQQLGVKICPATHWLPVALTAKGTLYGELIGQVSQGNFLQPIHLNDKIRQTLYRFTQGLFHTLELKSTGVYCVGVAWEDGQLCFDRLWPFPIQPALASLGVQTPDLFVAHYLCCGNLPLRDLRIQPPVTYQELIY